MLTDDQRRQIRAEEEFREATRAEIAGAAPPPSRWQRCFEFLNSNVGGWLLGSVVVAAFTFLWTTVYEEFHRDEKKVAERRANAQKDVEIVVRLLPHLAHIGTPENPLALKIIGHLNQTGGIDPSLGAALEVVMQDAVHTSVARAESAPDAGQRAAYNASAEAAVAALETTQRSDRLHGGAVTWLGGAVSATAAYTAALPRRVYLQIADESQRRRAEEIRSALRDEGYLMPGIENVGSKAPAIADVRYFREADAQTAKNVVAELQRLAIDVAPDPKRIALDAPAGQIEIWLAASH